MSRDIERGELNNNEHDPSKYDSIDVSEELLKAVLENKERERTKLGEIEKLGPNGQGFVSLSIRKGGPKSIILEVYTGPDPEETYDIEPGVPDDDREYPQELVHPGAEQDLESKEMTEAVEKMITRAKILKEKIEKSGVECDLLTGKLE